MSCLPLSPRSTHTALSSALALLFASPTAMAADLTGSAALTSDYVWRGSSQTTEDPAVQAGGKLSANNGLYASLWGSNVRFATDDDARLELDGVLGWSGSLAQDWTLDVNLTRYAYPGSTADLDWNEAGITVAWLQNYWVQVTHSSDALASGERGTYAQVGARYPLGEACRLESAVGRYWLQGSNGVDYTHGQVGAVWMFHAPFELRVTGHLTDGAARRLFPGAAGSRVEVAVQGSF